MVSCICFAVCVCVLQSTAGYLTGQMHVYFFLHGTCIYSCDELHINGCVHVAPCKHDEFMDVPMQEVWMNTSTRQCMHALACFPLSSFLFLPSSSFIFLPSYPLPYLHSFLACLCFVPPASCQHQCSIPRFDGFLKCLVLASSQRLLDFQWMYVITGTGIAAFSLSVSIWTSCLLVRLF